MAQRTERVRLWLFDRMHGLARRGLLRWVPDVPFLKIQYFLKLGRRLRLNPPVLYTEKLQWLKLHDRRADYSVYADKLAVRDFVASAVGGEYLIPLLATYDRVDEIAWNQLPNQFVIKCTHGSSSNILCSDKQALDIDRARQRLNRWMGRNWYDLSREWAYKNIRPRILVERYLTSETGDVPYDYKILCFDGVPTYIVVDVDRFTHHTRNYYDVNWTLQNLFNRHPNYEGEIPRPARLSQMLDIARALSQGFPHIRIDLYLVGDRIYFGEMTFFHGYGMEIYRPPAFERHMGDLIRLPEAR